MIPLPLPIHTMPDTGTPTMTLNQTLTSLGYTTQTANHYQKHILENGVAVFTGDSVAVWAWIKGSCK